MLQRMPAHAQAGAILGVGPLDEMNRAGCSHTQLTKFDVIAIFLSEPIFEKTIISCLSAYLSGQMDFALKPHPKLGKPKGPLLVCILDGWVSFSP